jgi:sterol desaturase/sphingolipid hydroxylase (fatty acid hydroxylase superfamily)
MLPYDLTNPGIFLLVTGLMFLAVIGRYFVLSGLFHLIFAVWFRKQWPQRRISNKTYSRAQLYREISWSVSTAVIFAVAGALTLLAWQKGYTAVYISIETHGWVYFVFSILVAMLIHETYYYWLHRWMHRPNVFKHIHKVHHESNITSAWTAFSFHPIEGLLEALIVPAILMVIPMHPYAIVIHLTIMTFSAAINHLNIEIYPRNFDRHPIGRWLIGATHHSHHHRYFRFNYGLYFTFWDKWGKTESPSFSKEFGERTKHE